LAPRPSADARMWKLRYIAPLGLLALGLARAYDDLAIVAVTVMVWAGLALATRFRPTITGLASDRRLPTGAEWGAVATGLVVAYLAFGAADQLLMIVGTSHIHAPIGASQRIQLISDLLLVAWLLLAIAPAAVNIARPGGAAPNAAGAAARGLAAAAPLGIALFLIWQTAGKELIAGRIDEPLLLKGLVLIPVAALLLRFGGMLWGQALATPTPRSRPPPSADLFGAAARYATGGWLIVAVLAILRLAFLVAVGGRLSAGSGSMLALVWMVVIAAAWIRPLGKLGQISSDNPWRASLAAGALLVLFMVSAAPSLIFLAAGRSQMGDAGSLAALVLLPVLAVIVLACVGPAPALVRRIAG
jgi:hypothetical protein